MQIKDGVIMAGLDIRMRSALIIAEEVYKSFGRPEGVTVTSALDGCHSASSLHYYGRALDFRSRYFTEEEKQQIKRVLDYRLGPEYDVVLHKTHIHVEYDPK